MREFNVTGICVPHMHYMVDISEKIEKIFKMVEGMKYFTINCGRQYGKTTTIWKLRKRLPPDYICASISFQYTDDEMFADVRGFCLGLLSRIHRSLLIENKEEAMFWLDENVTNFEKLDLFISERCVDKKVVLIIDEADEAFNNNLFVRFLKMLREKHLMRNAGNDYTFHSVIFAGVYDVRNLKQKMILQGKYEPTSGESIINSPWNIDVDLNVDMSFSVPEIETMLIEYENDYHTEMNISEIAQEICFYTNGHPYLVSKICQLIETDLERNWTIEGIQEALKLILKKRSALFDDMFKKIEENSDLNDLLFDLTVGNIKYSYNVDVPAIKFGIMFGFLAKETKSLQIHNKIFEIRITDYFIMMNLRKWRENSIIQSPVNEIVKYGFFDMEICLKKFQQHYSEIYTEKDQKFLESNGKLIFLTYLKPLINGFGFYHFESETRDYDKMDLVVNFMKQQFILELKLWYGISRHKEAYTQLAKYLKSKNMDCGYLLTFDFRRKRDHFYPEPKWVECEGKRIFDVVLAFGNGEDD